MKFKVLLHPKAAGFLDKADKAVKDRIKSALKKLEEYPEKRGERLRYSNFWKLRAGDYRTIFEIDREKAIVVVLFIGHRKEVYDDFSRML